MMMKNEKPVLITAKQARDLTRGAYPEAVQVTRDIREEPEKREQQETEFEGWRAEYSDVFGLWDVFDGEGYEIAFNLTERQAKAIVAVPKLLKLWEQVGEVSAAEHPELLMPFRAVVTELGYPEEW